MSMKKFCNFFGLWIKFHMHGVVPNWSHHPQVIWAVVQKPESWGLMKKLTKKSLKIFLLKNLWKCTSCSYFMPKWDQNLKNPILYRSPT